MESFSAEKFFAARGSQGFDPYNSVETHAGQLAMLLGHTFRRAVNRLKAETPYKFARFSALGRKRK